MRIPFLFFILSLPYFFDTWWKFVPATIALAFFARGNIGENWKGQFGVDFRNYAVLIPAFLVLVVQFFIASFAIPYLALQHGVKYESYSHSNLWKLGLLFQTLNEEMLFRAYLLNLLLKKFKAITTVSISVAAFFALAHILIAYLVHGMALELTTLLTLFLFGIVTNHFFCTSGNIALSFAFHYGWNASRFSGEYFIIATGEKINEWEVFNLVESSWILVAGLCLVLLLQLYLGWHKRLLSS